MIATNKILLIDANNLSLRALYGCAPLMDSSGFPTGCLMTTVRTAARIAERVRPQNTIFVWDGKRSDYRMKIYPEYKLRPELPEEDPKRLVLDSWRLQVSKLKEYLKFLGVGQIQASCEADDTICYLTQVFNEAGFQVVIASADADFNQLISDNADRVKVFNLAKDCFYDEETVFNEFNIKVQQWVEYRALTGDSSDNIKGVNGVGPKKASDLLKFFSSVQDFYAVATPSWLETNGNKIHKKIVEDREIVERNIKLMDLLRFPKEQLPIQDIEESLYTQLELQQDKKKFWGVCVQHELNTLLEENYLWNYFKGGN